MIADGRGSSAADHCLEAKTMSQPGKGVAALAVAAVWLSAAACNRGPAEAALAGAEQALAGARAELERYAPQELAVLDGALTAARADLANGHYTESLKAGQELPSRIADALAAAEARKGELTASWKGLAEPLPGAIEALAARATALAAASSLPRGLTRDALAAAQADLGALTRSWTDAAAAFQGGDVARAVALGRDAKAKADALATLLGLAPDPGVRP
jgi:hypothetical protein